MDSTQERIVEIKKLKVLPELLTHHLAVRPDARALTEYNPKTAAWETVTYAELAQRVGSWTKGFASCGLRPGDKVAMLLPNGIDAVCFDMAALSMGLVPVPLHAVDTPGSSAYILWDSEAKFLVTNRALKYKQIRQARDLPELKTVVITDDDTAGEEVNGMVRVTSLTNWLKEAQALNPELPPVAEDDLAALVYTSGTTGRPKGVMLTHRNVMSNLQGVLGNICPNATDVWFSFLPLSHTFERTTTYYLALGFGNEIYFNRNILKIVDDLQYVKPDVLMSVPRIFERIYAKIEDSLRKRSAFARFMFAWTVRVGYRVFARANGQPFEAGLLSWLDFAVHPLLERIVARPVRKVLGNPHPHAFITGGAPIAPKIIRTFIGLGIPIHQGYGMTETSPIVSVNAFSRNNPFSVGQPLPNVEVRLGEMDELQVRGPSVMKGYYKLPEATKSVFTEDGWLKTGDRAEILPSGHIVIKGRIKEIIVTSSGEKIPPVDLEQAIEADAMFAQTMIIGEGRPYIALIAVLDKTLWADFARENGLEPEDLASRAAQAALVRRVKALARDFPQYGVPRKVIATFEPFSIDNGMLTPTLKLKRAVIKERFAPQIEAAYDKA